MRLVVTGCSWTFGYGLSGQGTDPNEWPANEDDLRYALDHGWPSMLGDMFGCHVNNLSYPGYSNDSMCRSVMNHYLSNPGWMADSTCIVAFTVPWRLDIQSCEALHVNFATGSYESQMTIRSTLFESTTQNVVGMHPLYDDLSDLIRLSILYTLDDIHCLGNYLSNVINLRNFFKVNNIKNLMVNSLAYPMRLRRDINRIYSTEPKLLEYAKQYLDPMMSSMSWDDFAHLGVDPESSDDIFFRLLHDRQDALDSTGHPNIRGHEIIAMHLGKELIDKCLVRT